MLSDHELKTLRELERQLLDDDPGFPRSFDARAQRLGRGHVRLLTRFGIAVATVLGVVLVVAGAPGAALGLFTITGLLCLAWRGRYAITSGSRSRDDPDSS